MRREIIVPILLEMEIKDILRMSLLEPDLFDESTWRMLCKSLFNTSWDHYSFLLQTGRKRFVEIAKRKCFLPVDCPLRQIYLAIFNQRKDILERCSKEHPKLTEKICLHSSTRTRIYFNRDMYNFLYQCLGKEPSYREQQVGQHQNNFHTSLALLEMMVGKGDGTKSLLERFNQKMGLGIYRTGVMDDDYIRLYDDLQMCVLYGNQDDLVVVDDDNIEFWLTLYSRSQKRDIIERLIEQANKNNLPLMNRESILSLLYKSNNLELARKFEEKFNKRIYDNDFAMKLITYYLNTGDDRGLYESLCILEKRGMIKEGVVDGFVFNLGLDEVNLVLRRCGIRKGGSLF
nr:hypothetical protein Cbor_293 [Cedratvirus borely]